MRHHHKMKKHKRQMLHETPAVQHHAQAAPAPAPERRVHQEHQEHRQHRSAPLRPQLAQTGGAETGLAIAASAGLLMGGVLLYRRGRRTARN
ncbi:MULTISPECIES: LPXTG cell wall anchor domain-containing protein [unclassified Streptomyces]|uniref:LPXTG cell wall anchor domain-containing protein n=1 Tax=unclassified Streptomyces TaxID=2593676 RepID=UPI0027E3C92F|nr:LPXTG cell wall anchor domain-containing protein [Streptomyces sp. CB02959]